MSKNVDIRFSFPFLPILFLVFLTLKLTGVIAWSWWWVTAPLWGGVALLGFIFAVIFVVAVLASR